MLYDPHAVSELTGIPPSTLRRLATDHADLLSETARRTGRKRRYSEDDIIILRRIRLGQSPEVVQSTPLAILPVEIIERFDSFSAQAAELRADIEKYHQELEAANKRLEALEEERRQPWYKRIFRP